MLLLSSERPATREPRYSQRMMLEVADQATATPIDPWTTLLLGALGAAALGLFGAWIQSRREHSKWIREQRFSAYMALLAEIERDVIYATRHGKKSEEEVSEEQAARSRQAALTVSLLGPPKVVAHFRHYTKAFRRWDGSDEEKEKHLDAVRLQLLRSMERVLRTEPAPKVWLRARRNAIRGWWRAKRGKGLPGGY